MESETTRAEPKISQNTAKLEHKLQKQNIRISVLNKQHNEVYMLKARPANLYVRRVMKLFHEG